MDVATQNKKKLPSHSLGAQNQQLRTENAELSEQMKSLKRELEEAHQRNDHLQNVVTGKVEAPVVDPSTEKSVEEKEADTSVDEPKVLRDPFESQNPHKILKHPSGYRLGWKNPHYRENSAGWRGWIPVTYDDDIGRNLKNYLLDPPKRMEKPLDNLVRRGDSILCVLERSIWLARRQARVDKANRKARTHAKDLQPTGAKRAPEDSSSNSNRYAGKGMFSD